MPQANGSSPSQGPPPEAAEAISPEQPQPQEAGGREPSGQGQADVEKPPSEKDIEFWRACVMKWCPKLQQCVSFVPPIFFSKETSTKNTEYGLDVAVMKPVKDAIKEGDTAEKDWHRYLKTFSENNSEEAMVVLSQLTYRHSTVPYDGTTSAVTFMLPTKLSNKLNGEFDTLIASRRSGLIMCEVKSTSFQTIKTRKTIGNLMYQGGKAANQLERAPI